MQDNTSLGNFFSGQEFSIPMEQTLILLLILLVCIAFKKFKIGFIVAYFFLFYWAVISNSVNWFAMLEGSAFGMVFYLFGALALAMAGIMSVFQQNN